MEENRLIGGNPVIGIRPIIDGRRGPLGVRESLEEQTMSMAKAAKSLFESELRCSNGEPVKVIISDTTIGPGCRGRRLCGTVQKSRGVDHALGHSLLVLRLRNHGHGSHDRQGRLGL